MRNARIIGTDFDLRIQFGNHWVYRVVMYPATARSAGRGGVRLVRTPISENTDVFPE